MIRSTPHPPEFPNPPRPSFDLDISLFTVKPDVGATDALLLASDYLACAAATAYEVADNSSCEFRPLARSVVLQIKTVQVLVAAAVVRLEGDVG